LFGNPYLSFYVTTLPEASKHTIRFWLDYWKQNYKVIFDGNFEPLQVSRYYPVIKVDNEQKMIYMVCEDYTINLPLVLDKTIDVINSKASENIHFQLSKPDSQYNYEMFNCKGERIEKGIVKSKSKNSVDFAVPVAGFIRVTPIQ